MISLRQPFALWKLSRRLQMGATSTGHLFAAYYFGRRPFLGKLYCDTVTLDLPQWGKLPMRTNGHDHDLLRQIFGDQLYRLEARNVRRILDLGANIGMATAYLGRLFPGAEIACVEPSPQNIPLLRRTIALNQLPARVFEAAVGPATGAVTLYLSPQADCTSILPRQDATHRVSVPQLTVPDIMREMGWDSIDLLKIDIEGAEQFLLRENNAWLRQVRYIVGESHANVGYSYADMQRDLRTFGFALDTIIPETEAFGATFRGVNTTCACPAQHANHLTEAAARLE